MKKNTLNRFFSVKYKMILLIISSITVTLVLAGVFFDNIFKSIYENRAREVINNSFETLAAELKKSESEMLDNITMFSKKEDIIATVNSISKDYKNSSSDNDKKFIAGELLEMTKFSLNQFAALYDIEGNPVAFAGYVKDKYYVGIISYEHGREVIYLKFDNSDKWQIINKMPHTQNNEVKLKDIDEVALNSGDIKYKNRDESFILEISKTVTQNKKTGINKSIGYFKLVKNFDKNFIEKFSDNSKIAISFVVDGKNSVGVLRDIELNDDLKYVDLLFGKKSADNSSLAETKTCFLSWNMILSENDRIYFAAGYSKDEFYLQVAKSRKSLLFALMIAALIVIPLVIIYMNKTVFKSINKIVKAVESAKTGNYEKITDIKSNDELSLLSDTFNDMARIIKTREEDLKTTAKNLNEAQSIAKIGNWKLDLRNYSIFWSDEVFRMLEEEPQSFKPDYEKFLSYIHENEKEHVANRINKAIEEAIEDSFDYTIATKSGGEKIINTIAEPILDEHGKLIAYAGVMKDVTQIRRIENELGEYKNMLELKVSKEISRRRENEQILIQQSKLAAMGEMIGNIAHQWRQPLSIIGLNVQDFTDAYNHGEISKEYIDKNVKDTMNIIQRMSNTIDDFRNFFRPDKKRVEFRIKESVYDTLSIVDAELNSNKIVVDVGVITDVRIDGFLNEFSQVLLNIINNAKDALKRSKVKEKRISIKVDKNRTGHAVVMIADNAGGIPEEYIDKIFDPYFTTKHQSEGTGIGLYMSKMIIERNMKGSLSVENRDNGAIFKIVV